MKEEYDPWSLHFNSEPGHEIIAFGPQAQEVALSLVLSPPPKEWLLPPFLKQWRTVSYLRLPHPNPKEWAPLRPDVTLHPYFVPCWDLNTNHKLLGILWCLLKGLHGNGLEKGTFPLFEHEHRECILTSAGHLGYPPGKMSLRGGMGIWCCSFFMEKSSVRLHAETKVFWEWTCHLDFPQGLKPTKRFIYASLR